MEANKLFKPTRIVGSLSPDDLIAVGIKQPDGSYKVKNIKLSDFVIETQEEEVLSIEHDLLEELAAVHYLVPDKWYLITNATAAEINLMVQAIANNKIHTDAKSPDYPQDVIKYDFANNVVLWTWDTISDISVAQDLRNLVGLTIGSGCQLIHLEKGVTGSIGNNCSRISVGAGSTISIGANSDNISLGNGNVFTVGTNCHRITALHSNTVVLPNSASNITMGNVNSVEGLTTINDAVFQNGVTLLLTGDNNPFNCEFMSEFGIEGESIKRLDNNSYAHYEMNIDNEPYLRYINSNSYVFTPANL